MILYRSLALLIQKVTQSFLRPRLHYGYIVYNLLDFRQEKLPAELELDPVFALEPGASVIDAIKS